MLEFCIPGPPPRGDSPVMVSVHSTALRRLTEPQAWALAATLMGYSGREMADMRDTSLRAVMGLRSRAAQRVRNGVDGSVAAAVEAVARGWLVIHAVGGRE